MKIDIKWIALIALVVQNSGLAIMMRFTFLYGSKESRYAPSTAVLLAEVLKFIISVTACFVIDSSSSYSTFLNLLRNELGGSRGDWMKLTVPSLLYTLQNSLQYFSMSLLSAPVFQVLYQMKIITTALFSVTLLAKRIGGFQWLTVLALAGGVALVQLSQLGDMSRGNKSNSLLGLISGNVLYIHSLVQYVYINYIYNHIIYVCIIVDSGVWLRYIWLCWRLF